MLHRTILRSKPLPGLMGSGTGRGPRSARGAAVIAAMLVVAIAAIVAAQVFERQQLAVRSVENRMDASQIRWIERAASDWARLVLRLDARSTTTDHLGEPWATTVNQTELDPTVYGGARAGTKDARATLSGQILDAQARFNLRNLVDTRTAGGQSVPERIVSARDLAALRRLLGALGLDAALAEPIAAFALYQDLSRSTDLLKVPGMDTSLLRRLEAFVIVLPERSALNLNTAPAELLHAYFGALDLSAARILASRRERQHFSDTHAVRALIPGEPDLPPSHFALGSRYFLMEGVIGYGRVESRARILFDRRPAGAADGDAVQVVWRETL